VFLLEVWQLHGRDALLPSVRTSLLRNTLHIALSQSLGLIGVHSARWWRRSKLARTSKPSYTRTMVDLRGKLRQHPDTAPHTTTFQPLADLLAAYLGWPTFSLSWRFRCIFSRTFRTRYRPPSLELCSQTFTQQSYPILLTYKISPSYFISHLVVCR
jgi:hypothetical protein